MQIRITNEAFNNEKQLIKEIASQLTKAINQQLTEVNVDEHGLHLVFAHRSQLKGKVHYVRRKSWIGLHA